MELGSGSQRFIVEEWETGSFARPLPASADRLLVVGGAGRLTAPGPPQNRTGGFHRIRLKQACEDPLSQTPYVLLDGLPVDRRPFGGFVLRSVQHGDTGNDADAGAAGVVVVMLSKLSFGSGSLSVFLHRLT